MLDEQKPSVQKIAILYSPVADHASDDEKDSETQMNEVREELSSWGSDVTSLPCTLNLMKVRQQLRAIKPDLVFNLVEAVDGQGRLAHLAPALLDAEQLPYSGANTNAMFLTSNKLLAKEKFQAADIPTAAFFSLDDLYRTPFQVKGRYIVKSVWEHASIGLGQDSVVDAANASDLIQKMSGLQPRLLGECFAEAYIEGREFNISLLAGANGPQVLPPSEILFLDDDPNRFRILDYTAKWKADSHAYIQTPRSFDFPASDGPLLEALASLALACWQRFDLSGYARVDFRVDEAGRPFVLEVNTNPCLSKDAGFIAACLQDGIQYGDALRRILQDIPHYRNMNASRPSIFPNQNSPSI